MEDFRFYLLSKRIVSENKLVYYLVWINQFYAFCDKSPGDDVSAEEIDGFVKHLMKSREDWQVKQAKEAIQLFIFHLLHPAQIPDGSQNRPTIRHTLAGGSTRNDKCAALKTPCFEH